MRFFILKDSQVGKFLMDRFFKDIFFFILVYQLFPNLSMLFLKVQARLELS